ncbi:AAA family ATPase [Frankia sp. AgPm24]|uniref:AAA family ATPase n=1 Tax=Frankia sp. AgPm24 TaxID=631128 RepID=UPI00200CDF8F|nr:AAA family ATPase [Frankia sp. AgPm24]MCK9921220.1 AAA family ATPase [Frankia sp. AgPm24]
MSPPVATPVADVAEHVAPPQTSPPTATAVPVAPWVPTIPPPTSTPPPADTAPEPAVSPSPPASTPPAVSTPAGPPTGADRLAPNALRRQVIAYLAAHPDRAWTPTEIGTALGGRSPGAILNTCHYLVAQGHARLTSATPKAFQAQDSIRLALGSLTSAAPRAPRPPKQTPATPPAAPKPVPPRIPPSRPDGGVIRPSGQVYRPRSLAGRPDVEILRTLRDAGVPVLLYGPPGTGKTSLIEAAHGDLITVAGDGDTTVGDFVGEYTQAPGGGYTFVYGPLIEAMRQGRCLFIDDATLISPAVLAVVYPAMDGRGQITVKAHQGETITAAPGFYVIAGHNPGVHGAILTEALSSRFSAQIEVTSDYQIAESLGINPRAIRLARNLATKRAAGEVGWAPQLRELLAYQKIATAVNDDFAITNLVGVAPSEDRDVVAQVAAQVYGITISPLSLGAQVRRPR